MQAIAIATPFPDSSGSTAVATPQVERLRTLVVAIYCLLIVEGVLRKWVLPGFEKELFFIRDPLVIGAYVLASTNKLWPASSFLLSCGLVLAWLGVGLNLSHLEKANYTLAIYGWRNYFLYIPLAFLIGHLLDYNTWLRIVKFTLWTSIPIAALCVVQSVSSPSASVNAGSEGIFVPLGVSADVIRATGTFTSGIGQAEYIGSLLAILLWLWCDRSHGLEVNRPLLLASSIAWVAMLLVGGHRSAYVLAFLVIVGGLIASGVTVGVKRSFVLLIITALLSAGVWLFASTFFNEQAVAMTDRFEEAGEGDSWYSFGLLNRALGDFEHFAEFLGEVPITGEGLAAGGNAERISYAEPGAPEAEDDWSRNVVSLGPVVGMLFIAFRVLLVVALLVGAVRACSYYRSALPALLLSFIGFTILYGQISGQGTINGYGWLFAGFCMAANRGQLMAIV